MAVRLTVPPGVLQEVKGRWDQAADELDGAWRRLHKADTSGLSPEVVAAVESFREPWVDEVKGAGRQAQGYSDEIVFFGALVLFADTEQAERVRSLLPWVHHAAEIVE